MAGKRTRKDIEQQLCEEWISAFCKKRDAAAGLLLVVAMLFSLSASAQKIDDIYTSTCLTSILS